MEPVRIHVVAFGISCSTWFALAGATSCTPSRDLDSASAEYDSGNGGGGGTSIGGQGGSDSVGPGDCKLACTQTGCGDGVRQSGEACDAAGLSDTCGADCQPTSCAANCFCFSERGSNYMLCTQPQSNWLDAEAACEDVGMKLAQAESTWENGFLAYRVFKTNSGGSWLGATDSAQEGVWRWMDGTNFWVGNSAGEAKGDAFNAWDLNATEPNNSVDSAENCIRLTDGALWHDEICSQDNVFLCETRWPSLDTCGDGQLDPGEVCDAQGQSAECDEDCTAARCGDGVVNQKAGEECDDGNHDPLDACDAKCRGTGLVGYWPLLERTGTWAADLSDTGASTTLSGCAFSDQLGLSVNDGATDEASSGAYIQIPADPALAFVGHYTLAVHAMPTGPATGVQTLLYRVGDADEKFFLRLNYDWLQGGSIITSSTDEYLIDAQVTSSFGTGLWSHFALTYDGAEFRLYANGEVVAHQTTPIHDPVAPVAGWRFGNAPGTNAFAFRGKMANVRIYTRALSGTEVKKLATVTP